MCWYPCHTLNFFRTRFFLTSTQRNFFACRTFARLPILIMFTQSLLARLLRRAIYFYPHNCVLLASHLQLSHTALTYSSTIAIYIVSARPTFVRPKVHIHLLQSFMHFFLKFAVKKFSGHLLAAIKYICAENFFQAINDVSLFCYSI